MELTKIVITGGPCAGKSTAMSRIQDEFTRMGYTVLFVPETATELITGGVAPWTCGTNAEFQQCLLKLQLEKEAVFETAAQTMGTGAKRREDLTRFAVSSFTPPPRAWVPQAQRWPKT